MNTLLSRFCAFCLSLFFVTARHSQQTKRHHGGPNGVNIDGNDAARASLPTTSSEINSLRDTLWMMVGV